MGSKLEMDCGFYCGQLTGTGLVTLLFTANWKWTGFLLWTANSKWTGDFILTANWEWNGDLFVDS